MAGSTPPLQRSATAGLWSIALRVIVALAIVASGWRVANSAASVYVNSGSGSQSRAARGHVTCGTNVAAVMLPTFFAKSEPGSASERGQVYCHVVEPVGRKDMSAYVAVPGHRGTTATATGHTHVGGAYGDRLLTPTSGDGSFVAEEDLKATGGTQVVERAMSRAELAATRETGLLRGGREGAHFASDAVNSSATRAQQRLALPVRPEVRVRLEVPGGAFTSPTRVGPLELPGGRVLPGGGMERTATGRIPVRVLGVDDL